MLRRPTCFVTLILLTAAGAAAFDNNFFALMRKTGGKWKVVTRAIGCTDVCFADWWSRYKAPKAIFPYTE